ncbi:aldehyde dehydrogenase (NADP(+)) ald6, partial [Spiromyces aspiralis]
MILSTVSAEKPVPVLGNWVDNRFVEMANDIETLPVTTPHIGAVIAHVPVSGSAQVDAAVESAQRAFEAWSTLTWHARAQYLIRLHGALTQHIDELIDLVVKEHGKNRVEARGDVQRGMEVLEYAISLPNVAMGRIEEVSRGFHCRDERVPLGVVASVVPFNFPFMVPFWTLPIAIGCGNTMILKPSEKVPLTMTRVAEIAKGVLPPGVLNLVHGDKSTVELLVSHAGVQALTFVGTTAVAEQIYQACTRVGKRVLALGGAKNHLVAYPDCDIDLAAQDIVNSFSGCAGERCMAGSVLLIVDKDGGLTMDGAEPKTFADRLLARVLEVAGDVEPGTDESPRAMGPVIDEASLERIAGCIARAEGEEGARVLLDGRTSAKFKARRAESGGCWIGPTVLLHRSVEDSTLHTEIFGPVLSVVVCGSAEEAIAIENANQYGNAAIIYTSTGEVADWFTRRFRAGMLGVN